MKNTNANDPYGPRQNLDFYNKLNYLLQVVGDIEA